MGGLKDKLRRLEERAGEHFEIIACPECGQTFKLPVDILLRLLVRDWHRRRGEEPLPDHYAELVEAHEHTVLMQKEFGLIYQLQRSRERVAREGAEQRDDE